MFGCCSRNAIGKGRRGVRGKVGGEKRQAQNQAESSGMALAGGEAPNAVGEGGEGMDCLRWQGRSTR